MSTDTLELRTAQLLHEAVDLVIHHEERRRANWIAPAYPADMSILNAQLDALARD
jgi:hypothetical protein